MNEFSEAIHDLIATIKHELYTMLDKLFHAFGKHKLSWSFKELKIGEFYHCWHEYCCETCDYTTGEVDGYKIEKQNKKVDSTYHWQGTQSTRKSQDIFNFVVNDGFINGTASTDEIKRYSKITKRGGEATKQ